MGQQIFEPAQSWHLGAHATPAQDLAPPGSFALGENTILFNNTGQTAVIGQREGWNTQNFEPVIGQPAIIGMYNYIRSTSNLANVSYHLVVSSNGRFDKLIGGKVLEPADPALPDGGFTPGFYPPSFATMNNLCFIANGMDHIHVFDGTRHWGAGGTAPAPPVATTGGGVLPADTYSFVISYYDQATGYETNVSAEVPATLGAAGSITLTWVAPPTGPHDHPYTHTRVYMRQDSNQTEHFEVTSGGVPHNSPVPLPVLTITVSLTQDLIDALTKLSPDVEANNPPPNGIIGIESHVSRLFVHDGSKVYYSNLGQPEQFDPDNFFLVNTDDGQKITALHAAHEVLIIFKKDSVWALYGEDPATWTPRMISPSVGCVNERSIIYVEGASYWWSEAGPMKWAGTGPVENIAQGRLDDQVLLGHGLSAVAIAPDAPLNVCGAVGTIDITNQRLLWAVPELGSRQNNCLLPFKYRYNQWEATKWFGIDAASLASIQDLQSVPHIYLGGYKGSIFRYGDAFIDGLMPTKMDPTPADPNSGDEVNVFYVQGKVLSGTLNSITVPPGPNDAGLPTLGNGLTERYLFVNDGTSEGWQIKRIGSNTADTITLAVGEEFYPVIPNSFWTWSVGTIGFKVQLPWQTFTAPFIRKRLEYAYFYLGGEQSAGIVDVQLFRNYSMDEPVRDFQLPLTADGLIWDEGSWDQALWGGGVSVLRFRRRLAKVCFTYRWQFRQYQPNNDVILYKVDTRAETQADKR